jgi:hypothetical protein
VVAIGLIWSENNANKIDATISFSGVRCDTIGPALCAAFISIDLVYSGVGLAGHLRGVGRSQREGTTGWPASLPIHS